MHVIAAKAVALGEALRPEFRHYQQAIITNAQALAEGLLQQGLRLVSGGTDNHMMLVDLTSVGITGKDAELLLDEAGIACNKNLIPYDPRPPRVASGIRLGTPAMTTRGCGPDEMRHIAHLIARALRAGDDEEAIRQVRAEALALCRAFPVPH
jgi:glycine hydroxymethyltransferase